MEIQEYMLDGNQNIKVAKLKFKARSMTLDLKTQKQRRYEDTTCIGCGVNNETGEEIWSCSGYSDSKDDYGEQPAMYSNLYYGTTSEMVKLAKRLMKRLKERDKLKESMPDWEKDWRGLANWHTVCSDVPWAQVHIYLICTCSDKYI